MRVNDILNIVESFAPKALAYEWDNVGLLCGDKNSEVTGICVCLDASLEAVERAVENNCNLIITHHPFIYRKIGAIDYNSYFGKMTSLIMKHDISVISAHTNMDKAAKGINQRLAEILELDNIKILEEDSENAGMGRYGDLKKEITFGEFCEVVKKKLNTPLRAIGSKDTLIKRVAVGGGSCIDMAELAMQKGCDVFVTGDVKYHEAMDFMREGICIIDAGHYATEICVVEIFEEMLSDCGVKIIKEYNSDVYSFVQ